MNLRLARRRLGASAVLLTCVVWAAGCAGGWKNAPPPGHADLTPPDFNAPKGAAFDAPPQPGEGAGTAVASNADAAPAPIPAKAAPAARAGKGPKVGDEGVTFSYAGEATSVHLAGEFNAWSTSADALTRSADGTWAITRTLPPGRHAYKFVVNGTDWKEDPNAAESVDDGFGGKNSIVVVGDGAANAGPPVATKDSPDVMQSTPGGATTFVAPSLREEGVKFSIGGPFRTVHLAGDFNAWSTTADAMVRGENGMFTIVKKLAPGRHAYKYLIDGSIWKHDEANRESVDDGFGGKNSILIVE